MKMINENEQKILIAFKERLKLHLLLKDKSWRNGYVIESPHKDFFTFQDAILGLEHIFFLDLAKIEIFTEVGK